MNRRWVLPQPANRTAVRCLAREFGLPAIVSNLLVMRGIRALEEAEAFLRPRLRLLSDPFRIPELVRAVERLHEALLARERIVLYGDYDVDGVASTALLYRVLNAYGARVQCFLPHRAEEGYGLSKAGIERCFDLLHPELLVAVDCGTNSIAEIAAITACGVDVIVLDHHEPGPERPRCCAIVNPKRDGGEFEYLCSTGIAFKLAHGLLKREPLPDFDLKNILDLVALATLCDLVPLRGENRILVRRGLDQMATSRWPGLQAIIEDSGIERPIRTSDVSFRVGPRLNAAGRLGAAQDALQLLLTNDAGEARRLAAMLGRQNRERQAVERRVVSEAEGWVDAHFDPLRDASIVVGQRDWHIGVLGIVASRITRKHHRPSFVIGFDGTGAGKGSGRSIEGLSLFDALKRCRAHLLQFGGHEMAAGVTLHENQFETFRAAFEQTARDMVCDDMLIPRLHLDVEIAMDDFGDPLLDAQEMLEPFGMANPQPTLFMRGIGPSAQPVVLKEKHLQLTFNSGARRIRAIFFNGAAQPLPRPPWDIAFHIERNVFNGRRYPQMHIVDIRSSA